MDYSRSNISWVELPGFLTIEYIFFVECFYYCYWYYFYPDMVLSLLVIIIIIILICIPVYYLIIYLGLDLRELLEQVRLLLVYWILLLRVGRRVIRTMNRRNYPGVLFVTRMRPTGTIFYTEYQDQRIKSNTFNKECHQWFTTVRLKPLSEFKYKKSS